MSFTVTATAVGGSAFGNGADLRVFIFTSAATSPVGGTGDNFPTSSGTYGASVTVAATGSYVVGCMLGPAGITYTSLANSTVTRDLNNSGLSLSCATFISSAKTASTGAATYGSSSAWSTDGGTVAAEIKASGTLVHDTADAPATATTTTAINVTSAAFTPPAGSIVVVCAAGLAESGYSITDTSGLSLTWATAVQDTSDGTAGIFWAQIPPSGTSYDADVSETATATVTAAATLAAGAAAAPSFTAARTAAAALAATAAASPAFTATVTAGATVSGGGTSWSADVSATETAAVTAGANIAATAAVAASETAAVTAGAKLAATAAASLPVAAAVTADASVFNPSALAFPQSPLDLRYELLINGTWTDISTYVYQRDDQTVTRGHPDESTTAQPSQHTATWDNRTGRFSSKNPVGAYYPYFGRNTPLRASVPAQANYLRIEGDQASYAQAPDSAGLSITGDMDVRLDVTLGNWRADQMLAAKWAETGNERSWIFYLAEDGSLHFAFSTNGTGSDGTNSSEFGADGVVPVPPLRRLCVRVTFAASTGLVTFYTSPWPLSSAVWTQLGTASAFGSASIFDSTAPVQAGYCSDGAGVGLAGIYGQVHELVIMSGIGGTTEGDANFSLATAGASTYTDAQGNVWTCEGTSEISGRKYRGHFELSACPQAWDPAGKDVYCQIQAGGILRRLQQNTQTLGSAFTRAIPSATGLTGFWSCEDGNATSSGALPATPTQFASAVQGVPAGTFTGGPPAFASDSSFLCSQSLPVISGSRWHFRLPSRSAKDAANVFRFLLSMPSASDTNGGVIARMYTTGTIGRIDLEYTTGGGLTLIGYDQSGNQLFTDGPDAFATNGRPLWCSLELQKSGSSVQYSVVTLLPGAASGNAMTGTVAGTVGNATELVINGNSGTASLQGTALGQVSYQSKWESLFDFASQLAAYQGEAAGVRFQRLCSEQGVPFRAVGSLDDTVLMGAQTPLAFTDLLQECADADRGQICEPREALALCYRTRASLQNQQAGITLDYTAAVLADPVAETEDDQYTINDETVTRAYGPAGGTGSSYEATLETGPLSVLDPPDGVGEYPNADTINLQLDSQLADEAGWIVWLGTVDEPRYPQIGVNLAREQITGTPALFYGVPDLDLGDRLVVDGTPAWLPPDGITQLAVATTETLNAFTWTIEWCCVPEQPYQTGLVGDPVYADLDTDGSQLHASITSTALSAQVDATSTGELWSTSSASYPVDLVISGERVTVSAVSGTSSPQTFTFSARSVNGVVKAHSTGEAVSLFFPTIVSL